MKAIVNQAELLSALTATKPFVRTKSSMPILEHVRIAVQEGCLHLTTTTLEQSLSLRLCARDCEEGEIAVPHKQMYALVKNIQPKGCSLLLEQKEQGFKMEALASSCALETLPASDFPALPPDFHQEGDVWCKDGLKVRVTKVERMAFSLPAKDLTRVITLISFAASKDEARPVLSSLHFDVSQEMLTLTGANPWSLARITLPIQDLETTQVSFSPLLVPASALGSLTLPQKGMVRIEAVREHGTRGLEGYEYTYTTYWNMHLFAGEMHFTSKMTDGEYPTLSQNIPRGAMATTATVTVKDMLAALQMIKPNETWGEKTVRCTIGDHFDLASRDGSTSAQVKSEVSGDPLATILNYQQLREVCQVAKKVNPKATLCLSFNGAKKPARITMVEEPEFVYVTMPMVNQEK